MVVWFVISQEKGQQMTNAVSLSKIDREDSLVLRAVRSAKCMIDHRLRSGVFGDTLDRVISKLATRMKVSKDRVKMSIRKLMTEGLVKFAGNRLFACHNNSGCSGAYRRSLVKKGTIARRQLELEAVRRDVYQDPEWVEEPAMFEREQQAIVSMTPNDLTAYGDWAAKSCSIPPAGGWEGCCAEVAADVLGGVRRRQVESVVFRGIHMAGTFYVGSSGLLPDVARLAESDGLAHMMDTADLVSVLVDGERELEAAQMLGI